MSKYEVSLETDYWECGDGCCSGDDTTVTVNDIEIGCYGDFSYSQFEGVNKLIEILNQNDENLTLMFTVEIDEDGDLQDAIYLNDIKITNSVWACEVYSAVLNKLKLSYQYILHDLDWDVWTDEKKLILVDDVDEFHEN